VVLILTDDLSGRLMPYFPGLRKMLPEQGLELGLVVTTPVCGPSRASILTGQYAHNHGVLVNGLNNFRKRGREDQTFATWLHAAGYETGYFGKYLNGYGRQSGVYVPPGWDRWLSGVESRGRFHFQTIAEDGTRTKIRGRYDVDVYADAAARFVASAREPFLAVWAPMSPHGPFASAPRHHGRFDHVEIEWPASFRGDRAAIEQNVRTRLEMMLAVEEGTAAILRALEERGALDRTYVFFTTDNGVFAGEHGFGAGKGQPYEEASVVPLYVRGPGVRVGHDDALVATHDFAPTIAELAGVPIPAHVDGRSMKPLFASERDGPWRERVLLEFWMLDRKGSWRGLRTRDVKYARWPDGRCLLFRIDRDPDEMSPLDCTEAVDLERMATRLAKCRGRACVELEDAPAAGPPPGASAGPPACRRSETPLLAAPDGLAGWRAAPS
jgi:arylsulfatase A-like enzyme